MIIPQIAENLTKSGIDRNSLYLSWMSVRETSTVKENDTETLVCLNPD